MSKRLIVFLSVVLACGGLVAACGGDDSGGGGGGGGSTAKTGETSGAKVIDVNAMKDAKGTVTYCTGKDTSGKDVQAIKDFNAQNNGVKAKILEFSTSADEQRSQFIQRQQAKSGECDMFASDVIWTAEFASQKWLYDLTPYIDTRKDELIPAHAADRDLRRQDLGHAGDHGRGLPLLPHRPGQDRRRRPGSRSTRWPRPTTASSTRARPTRA